MESNILEGFSISQKFNITAGRLINFSASLEGERTFEYRIARLRRHPSRYKTNRSQTLHAFSPPFVTFLSRFCHAFCHVYCHAFLSRFFVTHFPPSQKYFTFGIGLRTGSVHSGLLNTKKKRESPLASDDPAFILPLIASLGLLPKCSFLSAGWCRDRARRPLCHRLRLAQSFPVRVGN